MRTSGIITVLASLLLCPNLRAEPLGPVSPHTGTTKPAAKPDASNWGKAAGAKPVADGNADKSGPSCAVTGVATPDLELPLVDSEGRTIARFGGVDTPLSVSDLPATADGKMRVTTTGPGRLRISGFVAANSIPLYLKQDTPIVKGRITLLKGTAVEYVGRSGEQIRINVKTTNAVAETYAVAVGCEALALDAQKVNKWAPAGHARGYLMKQPVAPLFDKPGAEAKVISSIHLAKDARGILFYGDRREGDFIHVVYRRDVGIDGWMSVKDLEILPRGEVVDQSVSKIKPSTDKRLKLRAEGQLYRAQDEIALYGKADAKLPPIGTVTKDTEFYVLDVVVGWASVLPKQLDVVPLSERHFWVRASEIGL